MRVRKDQPLEALVEKLRQIKRDGDRASIKCKKRRIDAIIEFADAANRAKAVVATENRDEYNAQVQVLRRKAYNCVRLLRSGDLTLRSGGPANGRAAKLQSEFEDLCAVLENICLLSSPDLITTVDAVLA